MVLWNIFRGMLSGSMVSQSRDASYHFSVVFTTFMQIIFSFGNSPTLTVTLRQSKVRISPNVRVCPLFWLRKFSRSVSSSVSSVHVICTHVPWRRSIEQSERNFLSLLQVYFLKRRRHWSPQSCHSFTTSTWLSLPFSFGIRVSYNQQMQRAVAKNVFCYCCCYSCHYCH